MADTATAVRYSHPNVSHSDQAKNFSWEFAVPVNTFWDGINWVVSHHFLRNFSSSSPEELAALLPTDPENTSALTHNDKLTLLLNLLQQMLSQEEDKAAAAGGLAKSDPSHFYRLLHAIYVVQSELGQVEQSGQTIRALLNAQGQTGCVYPHSMANQLIKQGSYVEAEKLMGPVCEDIHSASGFGKASPQGIGALRTLLVALWKQGAERRDEAEGVLKDIEDAIEGMRGGRFEVYVDAEREEIEKVRSELGE